LTKLGFHPKNKHSERYDYAELAVLHEPLLPFIDRASGTLDFTNPEAVRELNFAILKERYGIEDWCIPEGYLVPPIPSRADYIHHLAELLGFPESAKVLDIGTGANCIYPIIGIGEYGWDFVGTELDEQAFNAAMANQDSNSFLAKHLRLIKQDDRNHILENAILPQDHFSATMCNPPFFSSQEEADREARTKNRGLGVGSSAARNFGGQNTELWVKGGEALFISKMIKQSAAFASQVEWFSSLVSNQSSLAKIKKALKQQKVSQWRLIEMKHGKKTSRIVAWTYIN